MITVLLCWLMVDGLQNNKIPNNFFIKFNSQAIEFDGKLFKEFILGKTDPKAKIQIDKKSVRVSKDGFCFGLGRDRK